MLVKFMIENYLSIKDRLEINFTAAPIKGHEEENLIYTGSDRLLKSLAIYGANSSGKSNILKALVFFKKFVVNSTKDQSGDYIDVEPFRLNTRTESSPSEFEMHFLLAGIKYRYGFKVDNEQVHAEWFYQAKATKDQELFTRTTEKITVDEKFPEGKGLEDKTRPNALFLSVVSQFNGPTAMAIVRWMSESKYSLDIHKQYQQNFSRKLFEKPEYNKLIKNYLLSAKLGFTDIQSHDVGMPEMGNVPPDLRDFFRKDSVLVTAHDKFDENNHKLPSKVFFSMQESESLGTQKYFDLSGLIIDALVHGRMLILDEFDARLHPLLCISIIRLFNSKINNRSNAQLIFVSHNTTFLNKSIFRRDQIMLADKDQYGSTSVKSLMDYQARADEAYERNYLEGYYHGIPRFDNKGLSGPYDIFH